MEVSKNDFYKQVLVGYNQSISKELRELLQNENHKEMFYEACKELQKIKTMYDDYSFLLVNYKEDCKILIKMLKQILDLNYKLTEQELYIGIIYSTIFTRDYSKGKTEFDENESKEIIELLNKDGKVWHKLLERDNEISVYIIESIMD